MPLYEDDDIFLVVHKDGQLSFKISKPPKELLQLGARIFKCNPYTSVADIADFVEDKFVANDLIVEIL